MKYMILIKNDKIVDYFDFDYVVLTACFKFLNSNVNDKHESITLNLLRFYSREYRGTIRQYYLIYFFFYSKMKTYYVLALRYSNDIICDQNCLLTVH